MTFWIVLILTLAVLLIVGVERLLDRLGIRPAQPEDTRSGLPQIAAHVERWAARRGGRADAVDQAPAEPDQADEQKS